MIASAFCQLLAAAPGLAVDADAHLHLVGAQLEQGRALGRRGAGGQGHAHGPGDVVDPLAQGDQVVQLGALLAGRADGLDHEEVAGHTAPADGVGRVLDRDVVVDQQRLDVDALGLGHLPAHVEGHPVAGVVVDQVEHALGRVQQLGGLVDVVHRRGGEDVAGTGGVEHAVADHHHVRRLVAGAGALHDRDLVVAGSVGPHDQVVLGDVLQGVGVGQGDAAQHLRYELLGVVDELLHAPSSSDSAAAQAALIRSNITATAVAPASTEPRLRSPV